MFKSNDTFYKIRHKPTGLFYGPLTGKYKNTTNLSKNGKVYGSKLMTENILRNIHCVVNKSIVEKYNLESKVTLSTYVRNYAYANSEDFELVTYKLIEVKNEEV